MGKRSRSHSLVVDYQRARHRAAERPVPMEAGRRPTPAPGSGLGAMILVLIAVLGGAVFFQDEGAEGARPAPGPAAPRAAARAMGPVHRATSPAPMAWRPTPHARR